MLPYLLAIAGGYLIGSGLKKTSFAKGGSVLLAPNGKPSNLTPEQYRLVRTTEFKAWFGDWENDPWSKYFEEVGIKGVRKNPDIKDYIMIYKKGWNGQAGEKQ